MTDIVIHEPLASRLQQIAQQEQRSIEAVLETMLQRYPLLGNLPTQEQLELEAFGYLSVPTLKSIVREQMPMTLQSQMQVLMDKNSLGAISAEEYETLAQLVEQGQQLILRKAWAAKVLMDRGISITTDDFAPENE
ncbi:MAG: hypothetical protein KF716_18810 [Anaerolineae bacterium]|nr:hypothetical protein [Anaerolineae bacterium]